MPVDLLAVGVITGTHGLHGELRGKSFSGQPGRLTGLAEALFRKKGKEKKLRIEAARPHPHGMVLKIAGVDTPEKARLLIGYEIWVPREHGASLGKGEYYMADLCGCRIWFGDELIGAVRSVLEGGAAQLLEVENEAGKTFLVPFTDHFVGDVDVVAGNISLLEDEIVR
jgi:16S rRNA processing protein RimM